jgi:hypothetical protein
MSEPTTTPRKLRTPAQVAGAMHCYFDDRKMSLYPELILEDVEFLDSMEADAFRIDQGMRQSMIAYLEQVELSRWTPTSERLPPSTGFYLVQFSVGNYPQVNRFDAQTRRFAVGGGLTVLAWMRLPSLPAVGDVEEKPPSTVEMAMCPACGLMHPKEFVPCNKQ